MMGISSKFLETCIRVITFLGKKNEWSTWEEKFLAKSKHRGYKDIILEKNNIKIPKSTETLDEGKEGAQRVGLH